MPQAFPTSSIRERQAFEFERDHVLGQTWAAIGYGSELPRPGYARPVDFMGLPLVILRDKQGNLQVFHNVCSHRGMILVREECRRRSNG